MKKLTIALIAAILALLVAIGAALWYLQPNEEEILTPEEEQLFQAEENPALEILEFYIGDSKGTVEHRIEDGQPRYMICITLPVNTDFKNCVANITLPEGTELSENSPCYRSELSGRPVLDLTLENRDLIIENGPESRSYGFEIQLVR